MSKRAGLHLHPGRDRLVDPAFDPLGSSMEINSVSASNSTSSNADGGVAWGPRGIRRVSAIRPAPPGSVSSRW
ncbi:MAG TPA: hypothetical protein VFQ15_00725, partial [Jiangellaceae bacterium]|nr:hypothetical protein [Jiangellaceae bacterium]